MASSDVELAVYRCESCGDYQLGTAAMTCCGDAMTEVDDGAVPIDAPDEAELMRTVFDISETELEVCRCLMAEPEITVNELAEMVERDRSVVTRHLSHLVGLGIVEKRSRVLSDGGRVNVYSHRSVDAVRRQFKLGLYVWMLEAVEVIDDLSEEKISLLVEDETARTDPSQVIVDRDGSS
ncbi:transcriptional regulator, TrmB [Haloterrigena turkmenica DSM 5511]|uniref:Transcriptional regulator, TrmB n=1 Tax=Haloterrigena turkmenica (strain ATCC 51198 / DSM 5511 / JCM 9101 / NCIMB 13204 / VKM B-1734 / 4k) TaxID=543526 RepID=D2RWW4_HALTV|nr:helix-turn-helix domain-containing protein [Haloterrigena turkmenica]ADB61615.1 transcriptional regulator, TrmB [Haloterrigena turkmenica DSM 5511]